MLWRDTWLSTRNLQNREPLASFHMWKLRSERLSNLLMETQSHDLSISICLVRSISYSYLYYYFLILPSITLGCIEDNCVLPRFICKSLFFSLYGDINSLFRDPLMEIYSLAKLFFTVLWLLKWNFFVKTNLRIGILLGGGNLVDIWLAKTNIK